MHQLDLNTWPRRELFKFYMGFDHPHFGLCANVDLTHFYPAVKQGGYSISTAIVYVIARTANDIPEFRYRIRGNAVIEHDVVHPSTTILVKEETFSFCTFSYVEDFPTFAAQADQRVAEVKEHPTLKDEPERDNLIFMTAIPWVSFTGFMHPIHLQPPDSIPRFAWGKFFEEGRLLKMPFGVQGHHALMDGLHVGKYYARLQEYLYHPELLTGIS